MSAPGLLSRRHWLVRGARSSLAAACAAGLGTSASNVDVFVWLRGGADGLSLIVPHHDDLYYRARPHTALLGPGRGQGAGLLLTEGFALHPQLAPLMPAFVAGEAAAVVAVGAPVFTGSHRAAERAMLASVEHCWGPLGRASVSGSLSEQLSALGKRVLSGTAPPVALVEASGWDTHAAQGGAGHGLLAAVVDDFARAVRDFRAALGNERGRVRIVVGTEFGRSLGETPLGGTDDGHASVALVFGGAPHAGPVLGQWPGLNTEALSRARHLRPTTTLAAVLGGAPIPAVFT